MKLPKSVQVILFRETEGGSREYLVLLRRRAGSEDFWQPVSGSLEPGETFRAAAGREVFEETGLTPTTPLVDLDFVDRFRIAPAWLAQYAEGVTHNTQMAFALRTGRFDVMLDPTEHHEFRWEPYERARALVKYEPNKRAFDLIEHGQDRAPRRRFALVLPRRTLDLGARTLVAGVLNVTPDSFSDGGAFLDLERAVDRALAMEASGADIIDIGGESSRPGAAPVSVDEECARVLPVITRLAKQLSIPISIDTTRAHTARAAIDSGAEIVNDISALRFDPDLAALVASTGVGLILMHMRGNPATMQTLAPSTDITGDVETDLLEALSVALDAGVPVDRIVLDPGIGFGKTVDQNVELVARLDRLRRLDRPLLVGTSRKSFLGHLTGRPTDDRLHATLASVTAAILRGAHIVRVHDVGPSVDAARVADAVLDHMPVRRASWGAGLDDTQIDGEPL